MILVVSSLLRHTLICPNGAVTGCGKSTTAGDISTTESSIASKILRLMRSAPVDRSSVITRFSWISIQNSRSETVNLIKVNERGCCEQYGFEQQERVSDERERVLQQKNWKYVLLTGLTVGKKLHAGKSYIYCVPYLLELELAMFYLVLKLRWRSVLIPPFTSIGENNT